MPTDSYSVGYLRHERMHKSIMTNAFVAPPIDIGYGFVLWAQEICLHTQSFLQLRRPMCLQYFHMD